MPNYTIKQYDESESDIWDKFVLHGSINGTFLQTRKFIGYHSEGKFKDCSLLILKGAEIVACILACEIWDNNRKVFYSHKGTTFGGLIVAPNIYNATAISCILDSVEEYIKGEGYNAIFIKNTPGLFAKSNVDLIDYFFYQKGYSEYNELNYYMHLDRYKSDILSQFSSGKRRDYRYSLNNGLSFGQLNTREEIAEYYEVLQKNNRKLHISSVHSLEDLYELKYNRFQNEIEFYGVFLENRLIAGSMLFLFDSGRIVHTQYLSSDETYLNTYSMDYLIYNLLDLSINRNAELFTFGICTEDLGRYINLGLSGFKEGFGTEYALNKSFDKEI